MSQSLKNFRVVQKLGEGSYSQVFKVERLSDNKIYAMKKVKLSNLKDKEKENALNEVRILASINDPHIVGYKEAFLDDTSQILCIVMEYANEGDLQQMIKQAAKRNAEIPEPVIWKALLQLTKGLKKLHDMRIVHRDLKCANVFISNGSFKIGDLNVSKVAKAGLVHTQTGTPFYASPEVWRDEPYDMRSDIWSLGCVIYEMITFKPPFRAQDMQGLFQKVQRGIFEPIPKHYSRDLQAMISTLIQVTPSRRPSCNQILQNQLLLKYTRETPNLDPEQEELQDELLQTIEFSKNLKNLKKMLPQANYEEGQGHKSPRRPTNTTPRTQSAVPIQRSASQQVLENPKSPRQQQKPIPKPQSALPPKTPPRTPVASKSSSQHQISSPLRTTPKKPQAFTVVQQPAMGKVTPLSASPRKLPENRLTQAVEERPQVPEPRMTMNPNKPRPEIRYCSMPDNEEPFQGLVVDGLEKINPMSIQSILCQPVLNVNDNPFPAQAKVMKKKPEDRLRTQDYTKASELNPQKVSGTHKEESKSQVKLYQVPSSPILRPDTGSSPQKQYQHYYPVQQHLEQIQQRVKSEKSRYHNDQINSTLVRLNENNRQARPFNDQISNNK